MKKLFLSLSLIIVFTFYTLLYQRSLTNGAQLGTIAPISIPINARDQAPLIETAPRASTPPPTPAPKPASNNSPYRDGAFTGVRADAYYGTIQVRAIVQNGTITDVQFLDYPNDRRTSQYINGQAMPMLKQEAIHAQSASVNGVSGATDSSLAFVQSLASALAQAKK